MSATPRFTAEQRAAIEARTGSSLLAANAGSGKTAVMVERIAAAIREDGVPVNAILALTFTEKAAGELAERLRRRLTDLGEPEHARAVDGAWIGTIHGFCARLLRSQPLAAGLDPRFEVMEETAAERLANAAYDDALEAWGRTRGSAAIDLAASYGPNLRDLIRGTYSTLRARGQARPRVQIPPAGTVPDPSALAAACQAAQRDLARAGNGVRVASGRTALEECARLLAAADEPAPPRRDPAPPPADDAPRYGAAPRDLAPARATPRRPAPSSPPVTRTPRATRGWRSSAGQARRRSARVPPARRPWLTIPSRATTTRRATPGCRRLRRPGTSRTRTTGRTAARGRPPSRPAR